MKKLYGVALSVWAVIGALLIAATIYARYTSMNLEFGFVFAGQVLAGTSMIMFALLTIYGHKKNSKSMMYSSLVFAILPNPLLVPVLWASNYFYFKESPSQV